MATDGDDVPVVGSVTRSTQALVDAMGTLRPWESVAAESALALARLIDLEQDGSKAATLSRELRQLTSTLARIGERSGEASRGAVEELDEDAPALDPIAALVDEVARKRAERGA